MCVALELIQTRMHAQLKLESCVCIKLCSECCKFDFVNIY